MCFISLLCAPRNFGNEKKNQETVYVPLSLNIDTGQWMVSLNSMRTIKRQIYGLGHLYQVTYK